MLYQVVTSEIPITLISRAKIKHYFQKFLNNGQMPLILETSQVIAAVKAKEHPLISPSSMA